MRSLDECRAEVFARSENRIAKRRKIRRRVAAGLAPLCLCFVLFVLLPMMKPRQSYESIQEPESETDYTEASADGSMNIEKQVATVIDSDGNHWNLSENRTEQLIRTLEGFLEEGDSTEIMDHSDLEIGTSTANYQIGISGPDGNEICYLLTGTQLTCDKLTVELTVSELQHILAILLQER